MVEAILCPDWQDRYYSYNSNWAPDQEMASMRNGSGDDWFLLFGPFGAGIKGLAHESEVAGDESLLKAARASLPEEFQTFLNEPAFSWDWMSFCYWCAPSDRTWNRVAHPDAGRAVIEDGSIEYLALLHEPANAYVEFAERYYEVAIPEQSVAAIFRCVPLTSSLVLSINPQLSLADVAADAQEIGYPVSSDA